MSRCYISWALVLSGKKEMAESAIHIARQLTEGQVDAHSRTYALCILSSCYQSACDPSECQKLASRALELSEEFGSRYWEAWAQIMKGWALARGGRHNQGIEEL